ncbi:MAG: ArnT family glycosyltransferase [Acidobacteriota bacterium]
MNWLARLLTRWPVALALALAVAAAALLPGLGDAGLWEPQERQLADKLAPRRELGKIGELDAMVRNAVAIQLAPKPANAPPPPQAQCPRQAPAGAEARSLSARAIAWGRDAFGDSDGGRRMPLALLGLIAVLATCGIAMRLAGPRAGVVSTLIVLSMPLLALQSRQLTSEIGTAAGGALIVYALVALGTLRGSLLRRTLDTCVAAVALTCGLELAFLGGGALLGLLAPVGAIAIAGALGLPALVTGGRALARGAIALGGTLRPRWTAGRTHAPILRDGDPPLGEQLVSLVAVLAALGVIVVLAYQLYDLVALVDVRPGTQTREVLGHAIVPSDCWSSALGATWKPEDDLRYVFDSTFEQIAYGTYPWGVLAPVAMAALLASPDRGRRRLGAVTLAWAGCAWIAAEVFQRKVGFTLYAGFPAMAIAVGAWIDGVLAGRARGDKNALPPGVLLVAAFFVLAALDLGKDLQSFTDRLSSLTIGGDTVTYPTTAHIAFLPARLWVLVLGLAIALGLAESLVVPERHRRLARYGTAVALGVTALTAAFWPYVWQPRLSQHLSSKGMFDMYLALRAPGDQLVIMGEMGDAAHDYAPDAKPELVTTREQIVTALGRPNRVFAISPQTELCSLHRELAGKPYYVIDDANVRSLLLSNKVDGTTDKNPLRTQILHAEPKDIRYRPKGKVVFDSRIQLLGWDIPKAVSRGSKFDVTVYYKVLQPVGGNWKVLFHFDGPLRFNGDHDPIGGRCQTSTWQPGDYIVDTNTVVAGGSTFSKGPYDVWTGFFTGANPNWHNMPVSEAPQDMKDTTDRVKITTIDLE